MTDGLADWRLGWTPCTKRTSSQDALPFASLCLACIILQPAALVALLQHLPVLMDRMRRVQVQQTYVEVHWVILASAAPPLARWGSTGASGDLGGTVR